MQDREFGYSSNTINSVVLAIVSVAIVSVGLFAVYRRWSGLCVKKKEERTYQLKEDEANLMLDQYDKLMIVGASISTITFFSGEPCSSYIRDRVEAIMRMNPWLGGKLVSTVVNGAPTVTLVYKRSHTTCSYSTAETLQVISDVSLSPSMPYDTLVDKIAPFLVKRGFECVDEPSEPLFRVTVVVISASHFAIVFSMAHAVGDGQTFYKLHAMLSHTVEVDTLITDRYPHSIPTQRRALVGAFDRWNSSPAIMANVKSQISKFTKKRPRSYLREINLEWIDEEKRQLGATRTGSSPKSFASTNDILTSCLFNLSCCPIALMCVNLRPKLQLPISTDDSRITSPAVQLTDKHVGNYWAFLVYSPPDFATPPLIRQSVQRFGPAVSASLPGYFNSRYSRIAMLSNWTTFYNDIDIPGCVQLSHMPICKPGAAFSTKILIFRPTKRRMAIYVLSNELTPEKIDKEPYVRPFVLF